MSLMQMKSVSFVYQKVV